jgi:hypothetical protein
MKKLLLAAFVFAFWCGPAFAIVAKLPHKATPDAPAFSCTPQGFTLDKEDAGFHLKGALTVPTTGYTYSVDEEEPGPDGSMHGTLHITAPKGAAGQVVSQLAIDYTFKGEGDRLTVDIDGPVKSPDNKIECKLAESAQ